MADTNVTTMNDVVTTAYDLMSYGPLRSEAAYDQFATVRSTNQSHNGATVQFTFTDDLAAATTPLSESTDLTAVALSSTPLTVTLVEQGNTVTTTAKLRGTSFIPVDPLAAERVGFNAGLSVDILARTQLVAGTNAQNNDISGGAGAAAYLGSDELRDASAALKNADVRPFEGGLYAAIISANQEYDLRAESDAAGWRNWQANNSSAPDGIMVGQVTVYEGFRIIVTSRVPTSGTGAATTYKALALGNECLAKATSRAPGFGDNPQIVIAEPIDSLKRLNRIGWYHLVGYARFREESIVRITTKSARDV